MTQQTIIKRNHLSIQGKGDKVMLFAHGYGCNQNMWRFITPAFLDKFKIVLFDHVGSGDSDLTAYDFDKYNSLQGYADDLLEICEVLELKNITLVGHSVSCMIGLLAVNQQPHLFENHIMVCPSPRYLNDEGYVGGFSAEDTQELAEAFDSNYLGWSSSITPVIMGNPDQPALTEELNNSFCRNNPEIAKHFAKVTFSGDNRADLPKNTNKTLILQCSADYIAPMGVGLYVAKHLPNSQLHILDATGHCPHLSSPKETIEAINTFLNF
ncbi:MAG: alpha/beta fold hydrolase [Thermoflexibacteraceae bacterium]